MYRDAEARWEKAAEVLVELGECQYVSTAETHVQRVLEEQVLRARFRVALVAATSWEEGIWRILAEAVEEAGEQLPRDPTRLQMCNAIASDAVDVDVAVALDEVAGELQRARSVNFTYRRLIAEEPPGLPRRLYWRVASAFGR